LIVDDDQHAAVALARVVEDWGAEAHLACTPAAARAVAQERRPKGALIEVDLTRGFERLALARELEALYACKIVLVTGHSLGELAGRVGAWRPAAVLFKPVDRAALAAAVLAVCGVTPRSN